MTLLPDLSTPRVMAIINITPDSFYSVSRTMDAEAILARMNAAAREGADIFDIGAYSSRPGAAEVSVAEEIERLGKAMEIVRREFPAMPVSIDTFRVEVASEIVKSFGKCIINDISAGELDPSIVDVAARHNLPYIAMHMRGTPLDMQSYAMYDDIATEVLSYFKKKIAWLESRGVGDVIVDPGFGFAKTAGQNFRLLRQMNLLQELGKPLLAGISRKSMIYKTLNITPAEALNGTTALNWECLRQGTSILRVHDVKEAVQTVGLWRAFEGNLR